MKKTGIFSDRYARQLSLPQIGIKGQSKLSKAKVLLVGVGGLGSPAGFYMAAAGIGTLGLIDSDMVDISNLQRQIAHRTVDLGTRKTESAARAFTTLNPQVKVVVHDGRLEEANAEDVLHGYDFIVDATDNFEAKFLIADTCHSLRKPYSHAGIEGFEGQTMTVLPGKTACYRCVFQEPPPKSRRRPRGPLGAVPGVIGSIQATEAVKFIVGFGRLLTDRVLTYDALQMTCRIVQVGRSAHCSLCGLDHQEAVKKIRRKS